MIRDRVLWTCRAVALAAAACGLWTQPAIAASPNLASILPRGAQRGGEIEVTFNGERLDDAQELLIYEPGIEVAAFTIVNDKQVKATLKISPECTLGTKHMRLRCNTGMSGLRTFSVGALRVVADTEPNNEFKAPQSIEKNVTIDGTAAGEDVDYFVVEAKQGERLSVELEGIRLGDAMFDGYVAILNEARFELSASDDAALGYQDGVASIIAPADGKYIIQVRDSSYRGPGNSHYRLHIGNFPRPTGVVPAGGKPGEKLTVRFLGDVAGEKPQEIQLPSEETPRFGVFAQDDQGIAPSGNLFRISPLDNVIEQEPNEAIAQATKGPFPAAFNGVISSPQDQDYFGFAATKGQVWDIAVYARRLRAELDPVLVVYNAQGGAVASNDDAGGPDAALRFTVPADGEYFLQVRDHLGRGGNAFHYRIEATPVSPKLELGINEFVQYVEPKMAIPQGNRVPLLISATRRDLGGAIEFLGENLPAGVTIESFGMAANQNVAQLILAAAPEAAVGGKLANIVGKIVDPNNPLPPAAKIEQPVVLVRGQNNVPFWTEPVNGLPISVAQKVPFTLQIVEPKVPLVQSGQMQLKIVAQREGDFKAPIKVELVLNPNGVNSSREASIPEGQTETTILINAAGNAPVGESKLSVRGEATVGNGPVMVCSPFVNLRVAEPYLKFTYEQAAVELGRESELVVKIENAHPFEGNAQVQLVGLPNKVTTTPAEINKDLKELIFKVKADAEAAAGLTKNLFCQVIVTENGEPITHNIGSGQIRVDKPLPPKPNAPPAQTAAQPAPPADQPAKRLTRLEQLRLEQKQKLEAQKAAAAGGGM